MKDKYFLVYNPVAGKIKSSSFLAAVKEFFQSEDRTCDIYVTTGHEDIPKIVRKKIREGSTIIIAAGGDGTISHVVRGIYGTDARLCIVPLGTANGFAFSLGLPKLPLDALSLLNTGRSKEIFPLLVNGAIPSLVHVSIGLHAIATKQVPRVWKRFFGVGAYIVTAIKWIMSVSKVRRWDFTIKTDKMATVFRASTILIGGRGRLTEVLRKYMVTLPEENLAVVVVAVVAHRFREYWRMLLRLVKGSRKWIPEVRVFSIDTKVEILCNENVPAQVDGEPIGTTPIKVERSEKSINVIVPS